MSIFSQFFGKSWRRRPAAASSSAFRPAMEALESRQVMSASSTAIHAVADQAGQSTVFFLNKQDQSFYSHDNAGTHFLSGATTVQSFSAGLDRSGHADAFVIAGDKSVWEDNSSGWHKLKEPEKMIQLAAVKGDRAYAMGADHSLWEYSPPVRFGRFHFGGWQELSGPGSVRSIDAVTDAKGVDAVFALRSNGTLQEFQQGQWHLLSKANFFRSDFSAGLDTQGHADVFGQSLSNDQLWRWTQSGGWKALGTPGEASTISATNAGQVAFIDGQSHLQKFDSAGTLHDLDSNSSFQEISAARSDDVFVDVWDSSLWERAAGGVWHNWSPAGTVE